MENQSSNPDISSPSEKAVSRRKVVSTAAWSVPVVMAAVATPLASASGNEPEPSYEIQSNFGSGWYPTRQNTTNSGAYQFDSAYNDKYLRVTGTKAGDVLSNIYVEFAVTNYGELSFFALSGSNPDWTTPMVVRTTTVNSKQVSLVRNPSSIVNTNVALNDAPRP